MDYEKDDILKSPLYEAFAEAAGNSFVFVLDVKKDICRWSPNTVHYFGFDSEYTGNPLNFWVDYIHPDDRQLYTYDIMQVVEGKKNNHSCQYRVMNRYGKYIWIECNGRMLYDDNNEQYLFAGIMTRLDSNNKYDYLTGILTKNELYTRDFTSERGVIILFGIDDFRREINTYGYGYGDKILTELARRLTNECEEGHTLIRFTGDEFMLLLSEKTDDEVFGIFNRIKAILSYLDMRDGNVINLSVSGGAQRYPIEGCGIYDYIDHLEIAMDYVKRHKKGNLAFYSGEIEKVQNRKIEIKRELRKSIDNNFEGFELYFQPWIDSKTNKICGCESLLRWKTDKIKDSGPGEFIPILEEDDGIIQVGKWVMREAMKQQRLWQDRFGDFKVSFNVSYRQFLEKGYIEDVVDTAKFLGVKTENIIIELTESCDVENPESLAAVFAKLRDYGFNIALDDFGTGYASMELLRNLPADIIKIEHKFVSGLKNNDNLVDLSIIEAIMLLCSRIGCKVVVEGVENEDVDEIIRNMGYSYLQGYFYSRPVNRKEFEEKFSNMIWEEV